MKQTSSILSIGALAIGFAAATAHAENPAYAPGDLVLCFQKEGGTNTVYANLGNAATKFRGAEAGVSDNVTRLGFTNISAQLTAAFGDGWADDPAIYAGVAGVWGTSSTNAITLQDGDPNRTLYISRARETVGTAGAEASNAWDLSLAGNTAMTSASSGISAQNNVLENQYTTAAVVSETSISQIDEQNPFLAPGIQGAAMANSLEGGIQQVGAAGTIGTFTGVGVVEFALDLYRVLAIDTAPGQVTGEVRVGSYEGTVLVKANGDVSFVATAPAPEIMVKQPANNNLEDGSAKKAYGTVVIGTSSKAKTFTIKNAGALNLNGLALVVKGDNPSDFIAKNLGATSLAPGASTTFKVIFKPTATGTRKAVLRIRSNDANENPFDIKVSGMGVN